MTIACGIEIIRYSARFFMSPTPAGSRHLVEMKTIITDEK